MLLRFTGVLPVTFTSLGIEANPDDVFEVPDVAAAAYLTRADIEAVAPEAKTRTRRPKADDGAAPELAVPSPTSAGPVPDPAVTQ